MMTPARCGGLGECGGQWLVGPLDKGPQQRQSRRATEAAGIRRGCVERAKGRPRGTTGKPALAKRREGGYRSPKRRKDIGQRNGIACGPTQPSRWWGPENQQSRTETQNRGAKAPPGGRALERTQLTVWHPNRTKAQSKRDVTGLKTPLALPITLGCLTLAEYGPDAHGVTH